MPKNSVHEDVYEIHNDVSSLYHKSHHYSKAILRYINNSKKVRFNNSPEIFEYEAWNPEDLYDEYNTQNFDIDEKIIYSTESCKYCNETYSQYRENTNYSSKNIDNKLLLPILNRKEVFRNEFSINMTEEDIMDTNNEFTCSRLREIISIDGKYIQKRNKIDTHVDEIDNNWIGLKELSIEIDKISSEQGIIKSTKDQYKDQLDDSNSVDMHSTTESLSFL